MTTMEQQLENLCIYPECIDVATKDGWCETHWGLYPHTCEHSECEKRVVFDDEPMCFTHSPDNGSSRRGYSAYKKAMGLV
jgi:hypothetical protein